MVPRPPAGTWQRERQPPAPCTSDGAPTICAPSEPPSPPHGGRRAPTAGVESQARTAAGWSSVHDGVSVLTAGWHKPPAGRHADSLRPAAPPAVLHCNSLRAAQVLARHACTAAARRLTPCATALHAAHLQKFLYQGRAQDWSLVPAPLPLMPPGQKQEGAKQQQHETPSQAGSQLS